MQNLDDLLRKYRKDHRLSQTQFAEILGIRSATLADWERRKTFPNFDNLKKLCDVLKLDISKIPSL